MSKKFVTAAFALGLLLICGCESVNQGANQAGQTTGSAMRVPNSVSEGAAQGVAGQPNANPYGR
ncbi:MAG: hypothetical protein ABSA12_12485 [Verrucomicrobiia bacterium]|jgi:hypothetical protein